MRPRATIAASILILGACSEPITAPPGAPAVEPLGAPGLRFSSQSSASLVGVAAPSGLQACWSADGYSRDAISNNVGTLNGSYTAGRPGFGQAFSFNASGQGMSVPNAAGSSLDWGAQEFPSDGLTFAAWVLPQGTALGTGGVHGAGPILEFSNGAHVWQFERNNVGDNGLYENLASGTAGSRVVDVNSGMSWGTWHHMAVTYVRSTGVISLYRDGALVASSAAFGTFFGVETRTPLNIGRRVAGSWGATGSGYTFNGAIDEVQVYNRGLNAGEIGQLHAATGTMCIGAPAKLAMVTQPSGAVSGSPLATQPVVEIVDSAGTRVLTASNAVTVSLAPGSAGTALSGTTTVTAVNGVATFTDLVVVGGGTSRLVFTGAPLADATSADFTMVNRPPTASFDAGPFAGDQGSAINVSVAASDPDGDALVYRWDIDNDGISDSTKTTPFVDLVFPTSGTYTVKVTVDDGKDGSVTATTAVTVHSIVPVDLTPPVITPSVAGPLGTNGWYTGDVTVTWDVADPETGVASSTGCNASSQTTDTAGQTFTCSATNGAGLEASSSVTIKRDATAPTVTYSGNAGTYSVDGSVAVTCAASDPAPGSGLASAECASITGPAYTFGAGVHAYSALATDGAGNTGSGATSFTVQVTHTGLCDLVKQFVTNKGVANSLCVKLNAAAKNNGKGKGGGFDAFANEVKAQAGKFLPADKAQVLLTLAASL